VEWECQERECWGRGLMGRGSWEIAEDPLADGIKKTHFEIGIMKIHLLV